MTATVAQLALSSGAVIVTALVIGAETSIQPCRAATGPYGITVEGAALVSRTPHLNVDADGAPDAYRVDGKGLSFTCDGVVAIENGKRVTPTTDPQNWQFKCNAAWKAATDTGDYSRVAIFGFATDIHNRPLLQTDGDPLPGRAYISTTLVTIRGLPKTVQRAQIDSTKIPYIVLPFALVKKYRIPGAAIAIVYRPTID